MNISPVAPITPAWNHMVRILFRPFAFKKWLALGFCAFLATCGEQGSNSSNFTDSGSQNDFEELYQLIDTNMELVIGIAIGVVVLCIIIGLLVTWLSSRGKFMLIDGVVKNRGAIKEPWTEYKTEGNSLFLLSIVVGIIAIAGIAVTLGVPLLIAWPDIEAESFGSAGATSLVVAGLLFIPYLIACIAFSFFIRVFVVPTMYLRRVRAVQGMRIAYADLCKGHLGSAILLFLMMMLLGIGAAAVGIVVTCATCCIAALPYISSVVFLPITVFFVCYALCYIQQFGDQWRFFPPTCNGCGYDLQGLDEGQPCPECGE